MAIVTDFFSYKYNIEYSSAKNYASIIPLVLCIFILIFSAITEKYGKQSIMLSVAGI